MSSSLHLSSISPSDLGHFTASAATTYLSNKGDYWKTRTGFILQNDWYVIPEEIILILYIPIDNGFQLTNLSEEGNLIWESLTKIIFFLFCLIV